MVLLIIALFGFLVPNGFFLYWLSYEFEGIVPMLQNKLALGFMLDALLTTGLLAYYFARKPIGRFSWYWFAGLSILGGLGFSLPFYWWLNKRENA